MQSLNANLWPISANYFVDKAVYVSRYQCTEHSHKFVREWKIKNEIFALTWLAESWGLDIMENSLHVIKLKLLTENRGDQNTS